MTECMLNKVMIVTANRSITSPSLLKKHLLNRY